MKTVVNTYPPLVSRKLRRTTVLSACSVPCGAELRERGIDAAITHAEEVSPGWSDVAYSFLLSFIRSLPADNPTFLAEDVRSASFMVVPEPPSLRAWGGVVVRAARAGVISRCGYETVINPRAHSAVATLWRVVNKIDLEDPERPWNWKR